VDYIEIPNWDGTDDPKAGFQHYKDRDPKWIKSYTRLLAKDEYLQLTLRQRGLLHGIWLAYASSGRKLGASPAQLRRALGSETVRARDIEALNHAGFIVIRASGSLAKRATLASPEKRREEKTVRSDVAQDVAAPLDVDALEAWQPEEESAETVDELAARRRSRAEVNGKPLGPILDELLARAQSP
jgi:hypothetical protein